MRRRSTMITVVAAGLLAFGGCGGNDAADQVGQQATRAQEQVQTASGDGGQLSPEAQDVLKRSQALATRVSDIAKALAQGDITRAQAQNRLKLAGQDADVLASDARSLPETDKARSRLTELTKRSRQATQDARKRVEGKDAAGAAAAVDELRQATADAVGQLGDQLPSGTRQALEDALSRLGG